MSDYKEKQLGELGLWKEYKQNNNLTARKELLTSFDPLFKKTVEKFKTSGLPREALETQARFLAAQAMDSYDPNKAQLNTHITNHLKHMQRFVIDFQNVAKIPENRAIAISRYQNIKSHLEDKYGREPTIIELSEELDWSPAEISRMETEQRKDLTITSGEDLFVLNEFEEKDFTHEAIMYVYHSSDPIDQKILEYTFGLNGAKKLSVNEIAIKINKSPNFVKLRHKALADQIMNTRNLV